jgi:hypothetical protein
MLDRQINGVSQPTSESRAAAVKRYTLRLGSDWACESFFSVRVPGLRWLIYFVLPSIKSRADLRPGNVTALGFTICPLMKMVGVPLTPSATPRS